MDMDPTFSFDASSLRNRKRTAVMVREPDGLVSRNIIVSGRRTSMRLEPAMWDAFDDVVRRENTSVNAVCTHIERCLQGGIGGDDSGRSCPSLTSAVRVYVTSYFRAASTEAGHWSVGHGRGTPYAGTPFDNQRDERPGLPALRGE
jgi:predicted DNA-binding ribbon-helix-helix protein